MSNRRFMKQNNPLKGLKRVPSAYNMENFSTSKSCKKSKFNGTTK